MTAVPSRYPDLAAQIRTRIETGEWEPGARLPRLDDFASQHGADQDTIGRFRLSEGELFGSADMPLPALALPSLAPDPELYERLTSSPRLKAGDSLE
ncbi:hypothetical protein [Streptosporangium sp. NPDC006007]|uniref:hypothetical protein n=1 Tax=Streptosporangium sp. NPDC006007 TaxID=3154575 RepID=UPI0033A1DF99